MNILEWRKSEGLSVSEAARRCGVHHATWARWEFGVGSPSIDAAHRIINASGGKVTLEDLVKGGKLRDPRPYKV